MKWSKVKKLVEDRFVDEVQGRVEFFQTRYRNAHDQVGEFWISIDKEKIHGVGDLSYFEFEALAVADKLSDEEWTRPIQEVQLDVEEELATQGTISIGGLYNSLKASLSMCIEDMLKNDQVILRFIGILDKRCGKRRIAKLDYESEHDLVKRAITLRRVIK